MMNTREFLATVLGDNGYYCAFGLKPKEKQNVTRFYTSIDELADSSLDLDAKGFDSYFALGAFAGTEKGRTAENVAVVKSFFLDIDCGAGKPYANQTEAIVALRSFCSATGIPNPTLTVNSGRGLHVYWVLDKGYPREEWQPVASKLKQVCLERDLAIDPVVTADSARILRVLNTHNYKGTPPLSVELIGDVGAFCTLESFAGSLPDTNMIPVPAQKAFTPQDIENTKNLLGSQYRKSFFKILTRSALGSGCKQISRAVEQPNDLSYGEWLSVLSIAKYCEEPDAIHTISEGYEGYSYEETEKIAASIRTPHLCSTFEQNYPAACEGCPHKKNIKTPISLGMELREASEEERAPQIAEPVAEIEVEDESGGVLIPKAVSLFSAPSDGDDGGEDDGPKISTVHTARLPYDLPELPKGYKYMAGGGIFEEEITKSGDIKQNIVYERNLFPIKRIKDPVEGHSFEFLHHTVREGVQKFVIGAAKLTSKEEFRKAMSMNDIHLLYPDALMRYVLAWIKKLQIDVDHVTANTQFGWTEGKKSFVAGKQVIFADRIEENPPSVKTGMHFPAFGKKGTLEGWKDMASFYTKPGNEQHQFMMAVGFGAPLMAFVPNVAGLIVHLFHSDSGIGKTTGMKGGASIWGDPERFILPGNSTANGIWNRAEVWKNLPLYIDEVTNLQPKEVSDVAYSVSAGQQKVRMTSSGQNEERWRGDPWKFLIGTTGNVGLIERIYEYKKAPKGEYQRILETRAQQVFFKTEDTKITDEFNKKLDANFGHAGEVYIQHLLNNMDRIEPLVAEWRTKIIGLARLTDQNRIWSAGTAAAIVGTIFAKEAGLIDTWEVDSLVKWVVKRLKTLKVTEQELNLDVDQIVNDYYAHYQGAIMRIKSTADSRVKDGSGLDEVHVLPEKSPHYSVVGRYETDVNRLYLLIRPFKEWCGKQQFDYQEVYETMQKVFGATKEKIRFGKGTSMKGLPNGWTICIPFNPPEERETEINEALFDNDEASSN